LVYFLSFSLRNPMSFEYAYDSPPTRHVACYGGKHKPPPPRFEAHAVSGKLLNGIRGRASSSSKLSGSLKKEKYACEPGRDFSGQCVKSAGGTHPTQLACQMACAKKQTQIRRHAEDALDAILRAADSEGWKKLFSQNTGGGRRLVSYDRDGPFMRLLEALFVAPDIEHGLRLIEMASQIFADSSTFGRASLNVPLPSAGGTPVLVAIAIHAADDPLKCDLAAELVETATKNGLRPSQEVLTAAFAKYISLRATRPIQCARFLHSLLSDAFGTFDPANMNDVVNPEDRFAHLELFEKRLQNSTDVHEDPYRLTHMYVHKELAYCASLYTFKEQADDANKYKKLQALVDADVSQEIDARLAREEPFSSDEKRHTRRREIKDQVQGFQDKLTMLLGARGKNAGHGLTPLTEDEIYQEINARLAREVPFSSGTSRHIRRLAIKEQVSDFQDKLVTFLEARDQNSEHERDASDLKKRTIEYVALLLKRANSDFSAETDTLSKSLYGFERHDMLTEQLAVAAQRTLGVRLTGVPARTVPMKQHKVFKYGREIFNPNRPVFDRVVHLLKEATKGNKEIVTRLTILHAYNASDLHVAAMRAQNGLHKDVAAFLIKKVDRGELRKFIPEISHPEWVARMGPDDGVIEFVIDDAFGPRFGSVINSENIRHFTLEMLVALLTEAPRVVEGASLLTSVNVGEFMAEVVRRDTFGRGKVGTWTGVWAGLIDNLVDNLIDNVGFTKHMLIVEAALANKCALIPYIIRTCKPLHPGVAAGEWIDDPDVYIYSRDLILGQAIVDVYDRNPSAVADLLGCDLIPWESLNWDLFFSGSGLLSGERRGLLTILLQFPEKTVEHLQDPDLVRMYL